MATTTEMDIVLIDPNQTDKATTINNAIEAIAASLAATNLITLGGGGTSYLNYDPGDGGDKTGLQFMFLQIEGTVGGGASIVLPARKHFFVAKNYSDGTVDLVVDGQVPAADSLATGAGGIFYANETACIKVLGST